METKIQSPKYVSGSLTSPVSPYDQPNPDSSLYLQVELSTIQKAGKWVSENPGTLVFAGLGICKLGVILSARKANKAT